MMGTCVVQNYNICWEVISCPPHLILRNKILGKIFQEIEETLCVVRPNDGNVAEYTILTYGSTHCNVHSTVGLAYQQWLGDQYYYGHVS